MSGIYKGLDWLNYHACSERQKQACFHQGLDKEYTDPLSSLACAEHETQTTLTVKNRES